MFLKVKHYSSTVMFAQKRCIPSLCNERQGSEFGECVSAHRDMNVFYV